MPLATEIFPDQFISSEHFAAGAMMTIRIEDVTATKVKDKAKGDVPKGIAHFTPLDKWATALSARQWMFPKTMSHCLRAMFGDYTEQWIGKRVTLRVDMIDEPGNRERKQIGAIRVHGSPDIADRIVIRVKLGLGRVDIALVPTVDPSAKTSDPASDARKTLAVRLAEDVKNGAEEPYVRAACDESGVCSAEFVERLVARLFPKSETPAG